MVGAAPLRRIREVLLMKMIVLACFAAALGGNDGERLAVEARLEAESLAVGRSYEIALTVELQSGWSASEAGIPCPILQVDPPDCVALDGKVLTDHRELSRNDFLQSPFERLIKEKETRVAFTLKAAPKDGDTVGLIVLAYVADQDGHNAAFVRRRLELPLKPKAKAVRGDDRDSHFGGADEYNIGDKMSPVELPVLAGGSVDLADYLGTRNIIITMYRAHW
jgi:hypothetical protein